MGNRGLSESQKKILDTLRKIPEFNTFKFYLAGGAGLILHLTHRFSQDEDFFTETSFQPQQLLSILSKHFQTKAVSSEKGTLHADLNGVLCSFFHYPYPVISKTEIDKIPVASVLDIAAMKLSALISRGSKKDFVDLHQILIRGYLFDDIWHTYIKKFQTSDDELYNLLKSMVYFEDAEKETLDPEIELTWPEVKKYFRKLARELTEKNRK